MHAETRLRIYGIRLVVARHFYCLHNFKVVHVYVASVGNTRAEKSLIERRLLPARKRVRGNGDR